MSSYLRLSDTDTFSLNLAGHKVWYDESSQALILLRKGEYRAISLINLSQQSEGDCANRRRGEVFARFKFDGTAMDVKISPCARFAAVQRAENAVQILANSESISLECAGRSNSVLRGGVIWLPLGAKHKEQRLLLVTRDGLQVFQANNNNTGFSHVHTTSLFRVKYFWSLPSKQVLLVQTDEGEMRPFDLSSGSVNKWAKFSCTEDGGPSPEQGEAALVELYGDAWFVHIRKQEMILYRLGPSATTRVKSVQSFPNGATYGLSAVDSLLFAHSQQAKVSLLFDVLAQDESLLGECFVSPLPLSVGSNEEEESVVLPYSTCWVFLPPHWVLDAKLGRIWRLHVHLRTVVDTYAAVATAGDALCRFLLRRMSGGELDQDARRCLFDCLLHQPEMRVYRMVLPWLRAMAEYCESTSTTNQPPPPPRNGILLSQEEVCESLLDGMLKEDANWAACLGIEYAKYLALQASSALAPPGEAVFYSIARALLASGRLEELYQMGLFQILPSHSQRICNQVLLDDNFRASAPERAQVALDARFRLFNHFRNQEQYAGMLTALLSQDDGFSQAVRFCIKHAREVLSREDCVCELLRAAKGKVDRLCMLHNLLASHEPSWLAQRKLIALFKTEEDARELFGDDAMRQAFGLG